MSDLIKPKSLEGRLEYAKAFIRRGLATFDANKDKILQLDEAKETFKIFPYRTEDFFVTKEEAEKDPTLNARYIKLIQDAKDITETERNNLIRVASYAVEGKLVRPPSPKQILKLAPSDEIERCFNNKDYLPPRKQTDGEDKPYQRIAGSPSNTISIGTYSYKDNYKVTIKFGVDNKIYIVKHKEGSEYETLILENPNEVVIFLKDGLMKKLQLNYSKEVIDPIIMWYGSKKLTEICNKVDSLDAKANDWNKRVARGEIIYLAPDGEEDNYLVGGNINAPDKKVNLAQLIFDLILKERDFKNIAEDKSLKLGKISYRTGPDFEQMMKK